MHTIKSALAISLAALMLSTGMAGAVSTLPPGPVTTPETPIIIDHGHDIDRPHDPSVYFTQDFIDRQPLHIDSNIDCSTFWWNKPHPDHLYLTNNTGKYIPAGTVITWTIMPSGQTGSYTIDPGVAPGEEFQIWNVLNGGPYDNQDCDIILS